MQSREALIEDVAMGIDYNYRNKVDATVEAASSEFFSDLSCAKPTTVFGKLRQSIGASFRHRAAVKTTGNVS